MKADSNTVRSREKEITKLLINGNSREDILHFTSNWKLSDRQIDTYISRAKELVEKSVKRKVEYDYAKAIRRYEELYKFSIDKKDYKTALLVNKELTALQGLFKQQLEHSGEVKFICSIPD